MSEHMRCFNPPKAKVARSNRAGCANQINGIADFEDLPEGAGNCGAPQIAPDFGECRSPDSINENPGALAGATGAGYETEQLGKIDDLSAEYRWRYQCAISLTYALENAHPEDALTICCAALDQLRAGTPLPPLLEIEDEARWWASMAAPFELLAYLQACLDRLADEAMKVNTRKRLMVQLWEALPATDRQAFLARVDPQGQFVRAGK